MKTWSSVRIRTLAVTAALCAVSASSLPLAANAASPPASSCASRVFAGMTEDQRIGQLFLLGLPNNSLSPGVLYDIRADHVGSVWFENRTSVGVAGIRRATQAIQAQASGPATAGVRFFIAANQEGGLVQALQGPGFSRMPSALVQGGWTTWWLQNRATLWGQQLRAAGVNLNFAPAMDVVPPGFDRYNRPIGALLREYGHNPWTVGSHGSAFVRGMRWAGVAVTLKHFPGLGRVVGNTDFTAATDRVTRINDPNLYAFQQGIWNGADFVMVSLATYTRIDPAHVAALSPVVMQQMLRGRLGFRGVIVSDELGGTPALWYLSPGARAVDFLTAGGDLITVSSPARAHQMVVAVRAWAAASASFRARVNDAALRVLGVKQAWGLLPC